MPGIRERLGAECRLARQKAGLLLLDISLAADISQSRLSEFERGRAWPRNADQVVAAYERECGLQENELWRRALDAP